MIFKQNPNKAPFETIIQELKKKTLLKSHSKLGKPEQDLVEKIKENTRKLNMNNVTRTKVYLEFFLQHPEIHWAFLAHMVSRNGGWNMTDLKGEFLPRLMSPIDRKRFFSFLERSNWLIFQDAFPHTGSRKDYWPHVFNNVNEGAPGTAYQLRLQSCRLKNGARKIYSPSLVYTWKNVNHDEAEVGDWFKKDWQVVNYFQENYEVIDGEIKDDYCKTLEQLELAVLAKKAIQFFE